MRTDGGSRSDVLARRDLRRHLLWTVSRSFLAATAIVVAYFVLPFTSLGAAGLLELGAGLALVAALLIWQIRAIFRSPYPTIRAIAGLVVSGPLFMIVFATTYYLMAEATPSSFSESLTRLDALYFTVTIFATVGFGDITGVSQTARAVVTVQMVGDIVLVGLIARVVVGAVQEARNRRGIGGSSEEPR